MILVTLRPGPRPWEVDAHPSSYSEAGRAQFGAVPGVRWVRDPVNAINGRGFYRGPREAIEPTCRMLEAAGVVKVRDEAVLPFGSLRGSGFMRGHIDDMPHDLRDYQREGALWCAQMLVRTGGALLADDMGIGKSAQAIAALDACLPEGADRVIVCPAVVVGHWRAQIKRWAREAYVYACKERWALGGGYLGSVDDYVNVGHSHWHVYSYEGFQTALKGGSKPPKPRKPTKRNPHPAAPPPKVPPLPASVGALVIDEAHYVSNPKAARTKAVREFLLSSPRTLRLALTGTPMTTRPKDLWSPLDILHPGRWGEARMGFRSWLFEKRYCAGTYVEIPNTDKTVWAADGVSHADELGERLKAVMLRRTKADVALELPPRTRTVIEVELGAKAANDVRRAAAAIDWRGGGSDWSAGVGTLLSNVEAHKIDAAFALAEDVIASGGRPLVLTTRKATARELASRLGAPLADGDTPPDARRATLEEGNPRAGVGTIYALTTGIDLVSYDTIIFVGLDWVPSTLLQAEARIHRIGQSRHVSVYYLVGAGTIDEVVRDRVIARLDDFATIVGAGDGDGLGEALKGKQEDLLAALMAAVTKEAA